MKPLAVINVVGLNASLIGDWSPHLQQFARQHGTQRLQPTMPAVTCSVQTSMLTGKPPREHGIVANGWYHRDTSEIRFWLRSNQLVQKPCVWDAAQQRDNRFTVLNMFWRFAAYSSCDIQVIERPMYKADGRKKPDIYSNKPELRDALQRKFGQFPLFHFWGPLASIRSSKWIADATMHTHQQYQPTLTLVYLPHLDYCLQKLGPDHPQIRNEMAAIDNIVGRLLDYFTSRGVQSMIISEYGIEPVKHAIHMNRTLRQAGLLAIREEDGGELLDAGASDAFAVADHQVAHVYIRDEKNIPRVAELCTAVEGVEQVLDRQAQAQVGLDHPRSGDLVLVSKSGHWFSYYYWLDDDKAPDFARTVEIHQKPGYDPVELFIDPTLCCAKPRMAWKLFRRNILKQRALLDFIPLDSSLVRGSHGRVNLSQELQPILIAPGNAAQSEQTLPCERVHDAILDAIFS